MTRCFAGLHVDIPDECDDPPMSGTAGRQCSALQHSLSPVRVMVRLDVCRPLRAHHARCADHIQRVPSDARQQVMVWKDIVDVGEGILGQTNRTAGCMNPSSLPETERLQRRASNGVYQVGAQMAFLPTVPLLVVSAHTRSCSVSSVFPPVRLIVDCPAA